MYLIRPLEPARRFAISRPCPTVLSDPDFTRVKAHCLDVFQGEVRKLEAPA
jgi:ABC-type taurine transport system ATPase subunit